MSNDEYNWSDVSAEGLCEALDNLVLRTMHVPKGIDARKVYAILNEAKLRINRLPVMEDLLEDGKIRDRLNSEYIHSLEGKCRSK